MTVYDVKWLHVEPTSNCNAWCPQCPRNNSGQGLSKFVTVQDLNQNIFLKTLEQLPNLYAVQFCGNYGDPIAAKQIKDLIDIAKKYVKKIQIHTNGSLRSVKWWADLAEQLATVEHDIWFGIDGTDQTHEIYRQGTSYKKIISNAQSFIASGGTATWQFIPFQHNEHQIKECLKLSQKLGFKKFKLVKSSRNIVNVKHYKTGNDYELHPPKILLKNISLNNNSKQVQIENCMHLNQPSIYLAANGKLSTCCYRSNLYAVDNVEELLYNELDLTHDVCVQNCGT
jgi:MoaA/NifB/PqqE/SkfB family radical SAM enzyme